ncbi:MAG: glycerol-3-phosphate 1-O-acyltransferase PlsY [Ruminococcaceae bacterium]|nr:glycerol-3-phosphate 1-O-acyltransferase PlsY [Oscillospiraceae bacterium]
MLFLKLINEGLIYKAGAGESFIAMLLVGYTISSIVSYLLGSVNTAIIVSRGLYKKDIRSYGSKNAGMTNMFRVFGKKAGILTLLGDVLKALIAVLISSLIVGRAFGGAHLGGFFCIFGHVFPLYYNFKGGKGVLVAAVTVLIIDPVVFLLLALVWGLMLWVTKIVSVASITAAAMYPLISIKFTSANSFFTTALFAVAIAAFIIVMHKDNILRLKNGTEKRIGEKKEPEAEEKPKEKKRPRSLVDDGEDDDAQ